MNTKRMFMVSALLVAVACLWIEPAWADKLSDAIANTPTGTGPGEINPEAAVGYLNIPGAPSVNLIVGFLWAVWVGWIFSTVGAFGGIMAGVGHITVFGIGNYASSFKKTSPALNKILTDSIRVSNQCLVGTSAAVSSWNYFKMGRLVLPLAICLAIGSIAGSTLVPWLTAGKISLKDYIGYFGLFVLFLGCYLLYETTPKGQAGKAKAREAAKAFEASVKKQREGGEVDTTQQGVKVQSFNLSRVVFTFFGVEFSFNPIIPVIGGFVIASVASFLGVGGGFLLVPFLTSVAGLPMYLVAGTSALAVLIGMITSIASYITMGATIHWHLIGVELLGILLGSVIGPRTSKYIPEKVLKYIFIVLAFYVGLRYASKGLFGLSLLPPY